MSLRVCAAVFLAAPLLLTGCTSGSGEPPEPIPGSGGIDPGDLYPEGPYGTSIGSVIKNYRFPGYTRPGNGLGEATRGDVALGDFFNPDGNGTYPEDSPYDPGGEIPRAVVINVSAVWCGPCKFEAKNILPEEYEHYKPLGTEIMLVLADSINPGEAADFGNLDNWVSTYDALYPSVIDPDYQMGALFDTNSFPANFIVDTRDMTIVEIVTGVPQQGFWDKVEEVISQEPAGPTPEE